MIVLGEGIRAMDRQYSRKVEYRGFILAEWAYQGHEMSGEPAAPRPRWDVLDRNSRFLRTFTNRLHAETYVDHLPAR